MPGRGVYAGWAEIDGGEHAAVINIGLRPTFEGDAMATVEAHLLDYASDLYGREIRLSFVARLREEKKFDGVDALVAQINQDIRRGREILSG